MEKNALDKQKFIKSINYLRYDMKENEECCEEKSARMCVVYKEEAKRMGNEKANHQSIPRQYIFLISQSFLLHARRSSSWTVRYMTDEINENVV